MQHFKSYLINKMYHMRISGTEPSSSWTKESSVKEVTKWHPNVPKQDKAISDGDVVINPQNYNIIEFYTRKIWCSQTLRIKRSRP